MWNVVTTLEREVVLGEGKPNYILATIDADEKTRSARGGLLLIEHDGLLYGIGAQAD